MMKSGREGVVVVVVGSVGRLVDPFIKLLYFLYPLMDCFHI